MTGAKRRRLTGAGIEKLSSETQQISEGIMILTPVSVLHSRKKGGLKRYEKSELKELYQMMFPEYPDIVTVRQLREMLGISRQLAYDLINDGELQAIKIGNSFKIPKVSVINFVTEEKKEVKFSA